MIYIKSFVKGNKMGFIIPEPMWETVTPNLDPDEWVDEDDD